MKLVVDTNIIFSALLNSSGKIGKILINSSNHFDFYTCDFMRVELLKHRNKLIKRTKLSETQLEEIELLLTSKITFINEKLIPIEVLTKTELLLHNIDVNDVPFVALASHLKATLWTGDKKLYEGVRKKKYKSIITTADLSNLLDKLEQ